MLDRVGSCRSQEENSVMSGGVVRPPSCPDLQGLEMETHSQPGPGTLEPTQSHSTHSHTHRMTRTQSRVMSFRALNLTNLGTPTCSLGPHGGQGTMLVCGQLLPFTSHRPGHTPMKTP